MARQLGVEYEEALYHVLARGNERRPIFTDSDDYERSLDIFCESLALFDVQCLVLALMRTLLSCHSANFEAEPEYIHASPQYGLQHIL